MDTIFLVSSILLWIVVLLNLVLTFALIRRVNAFSSQNAMPLESGLPSGTQAPDFSAMTLTGDTVTLADYTQRPTTFVFISPHCQPCHDLLPTLKTLAPQANAAGENLVLVSDGTLEENQQMAQSDDIQLPLLVAPRQENTFFQDYQLRGTPSYCSLDEQGRVLSAGTSDPFNQHWKELTQRWNTQTVSTKRSN